MGLIILILIVLGVIYYSHVLNILITDMPKNNRYLLLKRRPKSINIKTVLSSPFKDLYNTIKNNKRDKRNVHVLVLTAGIILSLFVGEPVLLRWVQIIVYSILIICFYTDIEYQIIPNEFSFGLILIGLIYSMYTKNILDSLLGIIVVIVVFSLFSIVLLLKHGSKIKILSHGD